MQLSMRDSPSTSLAEPPHGWTLICNFPGLTLGYKTLRSRHALKSLILRTLKEEILDFYFCFSTAFPVIHPKRSDWKSVEVVSALKMTDIPNVIPYSGISHFYRGKLSR
jgi:hypothetical protein